MNQFADKVIKGEIKSAAKLMRMIEDEDLKAIVELKKLFPFTGKAHVIGVTGLPGAGKSSVIDCLIERYRADNKNVGVIAVDPTSPFSGGSLLGDRVRMQEHASDDGVFIKSIPTRGFKGGVSKLTSSFITVLDAMGKDVVMVETTGVGQSEIEIKKLVHTTIVVLVGGLGDYIQVIKAGIMEIADIFVINKADKEDSAEDLKIDLQNLLGFNNGETPGSWKPEIYMTSAIKNTGFSHLLKGLNSHRDFLQRSGRFSSFFKDMQKIQIKEIVMDHIIDLINEKLIDDSMFEKLSERMLNNQEQTPDKLSKILAEFFMNKIK
jgi:LAO/AO transport system kinase